MQLNRMDLPAENPDEGHQIQFCMNEHWFYIVMSALEQLEYEGSWTEGTNMTDALGKVYTLTGMLALAQEECEVMPAEYVKRIDVCPGDLPFPGIFRITSVVDGVEVIEDRNLAQCLEFVTHVGDCIDGTMQVQYNRYGANEVEYADISACIPEPIPGPKGDTGDTGPQGPQGGQGDTGPAGQNGQDGVCIGCEPAAPEPATGPDDHCGAATYFVDWIDDRFDDILGVLEVTADVAQFVDSIVELFGPFDLAIGGIPGIISASSGLASSVLRANVNSVVLEDLRCSLFCAFETAGNTSYQTLIDWAEAENALAGANVGVHVWLSLVLNVFPESETSRRVYIGSLSTSTECAALCDDCGDDECESGSFSVPANSGAGGGTSFITQSDKWYTVTWTGTAITQTSAPVQTFDGFYYTTNGTTWLLGSARMQYRKNGVYTSFPVPTRSTTQTYSFVFKGDGVENISLRLADATYGNNSGSWTINVTCHTSNPGGTVIQL